MSKSARMRLAKMYFDPKVKAKRVTESLWDALPGDCKELVRDFEKEHSMAQRIQRHYRKVRYAPGAAPAFAYKQRVMMFWQRSRGGYLPWAIGDVGRKGVGHYDARIYPDNTYRTVYYYDQVKREARHRDWALRGFFNVGGENCARSPHEPRCVAIIKPW
jgi:hypothetical protein